METVGVNMKTSHRMLFPALIYAIFSTVPTMAANVVISGGNTSVTTVGGKEVTTTTGCVQGNGVEKSQTRDLGDITKIVFNGAYDVHVTSGSRPGFTIRGDENIIDLIAHRQEGDTLKVHPEKSICPQRELQVDITVEAITSVSVLGTVNATIEGVEADSLRIKVDGSSTVSASGKTQSLEALLGGSGTLRAEDLHSAEAAVSISGVGEAYVFVTDHLSANITGVGSVYYSGDPKTVDRAVTGIGSVVSR